MRDFGIAAVGYKPWNRPAPRSHINPLNMDDERHANFCAANGYRTNQTLSTVFFFVALQLLTEFPRFGRRLNLPARVQRPVTYAIAGINRQKRRVIFRKCPVNIRRSGSS
jgi:hypothetical protein